MPAVRTRRMLLHADRKLLTLQVEAAFLIWVGKGCQVCAVSQSKASAHIQQPNTDDPADAVCRSQPQNNSLRAAHGVVLVAAQQDCQRSKKMQQPKPKALLCFPILQEEVLLFLCGKGKHPSCSPPPTFPENDAIEAPFVCGKREEERFDRGTSTDFRVECNRKVSLNLQSLDEKDGSSQSLS
ncbi:hypothetical protein MJG53_016470 [Ovis ammon polii x Ovis aries]|uniref:Uncharacterized protein n=1 Tax=Ovis ammon polii x Ovis aries TaxID=2918886 RepID=A0ACB9UBQ6_9CETA|nr:hypothetical protein MJG53_016470 [Ovis ammon polii x Ovis aries]